MVQLIDTTADTGVFTFLDENVTQNPEKLFVSAEIKDAKEIGPFSLDCYTCKFYKK